MSVNPVSAIIAALNSLIKQSFLNQTGFFYQTNQKKGKILS